MDCCSNLDTRIIHKDIREFRIKQDNILKFESLLEKSGQKDIMDKIFKKKIGSEKNKDQKKPEMDPDQKSLIMSLNLEGPKSSKK